MDARRRLLLAAAMLFALSCALPARALASATQEAILMDDNEFIYSSPSRVAQALERIAALGVNRVKVSVVWSLVAPDASSTHRPSFNASDPAAYPPGVWNRYDTVVRLAKALGLGVYFQLTAPAPAWAVATGVPTQGYPWSQMPSPRQFGEFARAVGRRYSGTYAIPAGETIPAPPPPSLLGIPLGAQPPPPPPPGPPDLIPRVDYWGIWNEPNEGAWLNPQTRVVGRTQYPVAPALYRGLVDAAWSGLVGSGHLGDTVLIGETASGGIIRPLPFLQALYCVSSRLRPLTGNLAAAYSCPTSGNRTDFTARHPGLFLAGFAHHPYSFDVPPNSRMHDRDVITLADLPTLEHELDRIFAGYGKLPPGGVPLYLTEWGYKTNPPNPFVRTSPSQQAMWINQGEYMTWSDPRVRALAQFLLIDDRPRANATVGSRAYWGTFQTGLIGLNGAQKPGYGAFRIPIWLPVARHGRHVAVWGQLRPGSHATPLYAALLYRPNRGSWTRIREIQTANPRGFLLAHLAIPSPGLVKLAWLVPGSRTVYYSRTVSVS